MTFHNETSAPNCLMAGDILLVNGTQLMTRLLQLVLHPYTNDAVSN
jgi:hypothetical protein